MENPQAPHVLMLPFPAVGHIKPMLMLGKLLCQAGLSVTLLNTDQNHNNILNPIDQSSFYSRYPGFQFKSLAVGLPPEHLRTGPVVAELLYWITSACSTKFKEYLMVEENEKGQPEPVTCIIADGIMSFTIDIAEEFHIPVITFRTYNSTSTWVYFHLHQLLQNGEIPVQRDEDMDQQITSIPGLETILRRRDLPPFCKLDSTDHLLQFYMGQTSKMKRASALILNTFEELEGPIVSHLHSIFPTVYTIGPLHGLLQSHINHNAPPSDSSETSVRPQDRTCIRWLDSQPSKSVVYVSFGSVVVLTQDQLLEFWHGLVNSGSPFLWVIRPGLVLAENNVAETPSELTIATNERGCIVGWGPQEEVLAHRAVGGFLSHSGWNSTLESIWAGMPMICWPQIADQWINSRCVGEMWRTGLDMKDTCDRSTVEKMVRGLMEDKNEEIRKSTAIYSSMARNSVAKGGSSYHSMSKLIEDIKSIQ
uniref:Glycosyltransferase n=1 Tax=Panax ginseng TaxID=4054 RepID=A0A068JAU5_PANGI|nr:UGT5 [Panax ginseng]